MGRNDIPHDVFVRKLFSDRQLAMDYFKAFLPASVIRILDFDTLRRVSDTYVSDQLKHSMSDTVYSCDMLGGKQRVIISLLLEHKSYPDPFISVQLGQYIFSAMQDQLKNQKPLSLVIPILLYHGKQKWRYITDSEII